ncbi:hypothetical protein EDB82DRAFT_571154 [Fusarium venenatum]|uniref:uncharacterized protein n=1 Tax=Fusarium venenatum TaxID=56646 RepID=UPI001DB15AB8|nr:hypothetical protein EDB82DRAFT_571154 [Fusarium venenatum]
MSGHSGSTQRDISNSAFDGDTSLHQGDVHNNVYYSSPHPIPHAGVIRVIPYSRNEDLIHRQDFMERLDELPPSTPESCSAALWGLGGSGKTQIALYYAYRRCDNDRERCVFWVHAEREATFSADYKTIGKKLGIDNKLNGTMLLDAIEARKLLVGDTRYPGHSTRNVKGCRSREYLGYLKQGKSRWDVLGISTEQIRTESIISYHILHVIAYVDNQDIQQELLGVVASSFALDGEDYEDEQDLFVQTSELEIPQSVARLEEFSFLNLRRTDDGERRYEMNKLVQEAVRYDLRIRNLLENTTCNEPEDLETFHSAKALRIVDGLFPRIWGPSSWAQCERYVTHAVRMGEWAEMSGTEAQTVDLLHYVAQFLYDRGRWRETEPLYDRVFILRRGMLGEKGPDTTTAMSNLAIVYNRYDEAEVLQDKALRFCCNVLGEKHRITIQAMTDLVQTYIKQNRLDEAQKAIAKAPEIGQEVQGEKHQDKIRAMTLLADTYSLLGQHKEGEEILIKAISLGKEVFGETHPQTIAAMMLLAWSYNL